MPSNQYEMVIGLEVHVQLATKSKLFSGASTTFGAEPNTQACEVDLALPGVLPVLNKMAVEMGIRLGLAVDGEITQQTVFARKNYFYPDLPKSYQISQLDKPIVQGGYLDVILESTGETKRVALTRAHLEEDAGKSVHDAFDAATGVDLNRSGVPLLEIVSEPDMHTAEEALAFLKALNALVRYLEISDGNLSEGSMRCDVNISLRKPGAPLGTRAEIKNVNSYRFVEQAIAYEYDRQADLLERGESIVQETRLFDANQKTTRAMRNKEVANDYRYFPDPDLLPVVITPADIERVRTLLPELPAARRARFVTAFALSEVEAGVLTADKATAEYFERVARLSDNPKAAANWVIVEVLGYLNKMELHITDFALEPRALAQIITYVKDDKISGKMAKMLFAKLCEAPEMSPDAIIAREGWQQISNDDELVRIIDEIIANNPKQVAQYQAADENKQPRMLGFFVGQAMKATQGQANPQKLNTLLRDKLTG